MPSYFALRDKDVQRTGNMLPIKLVAFTENEKSPGRVGLGFGEETRGLVLRFVAATQQGGGTKTENGHAGWLGDGRDRHIKELVVRGKGTVL